KDSDVITCLKKAVTPYEENTILQWEGEEKLAVLDIDYHGKDVPESIKRTIGHVRPKPFCGARSKSGGWHGYYLAQEPFTAEELAAVGGITWMNLDRTCIFDIVK